MTNILEGIKVIEVSSMAAAPTTGVLLADFGAEVIKVEPPTGDPWRFANQLGGMPPSKIPYATCIRNRTKKSLALNLKHPDAQAALHKLVETADTFLTNSPLKVQSACGHTYEVIREVNPKIVYARINRFGMKNPDKDLPGFDMTAWYARCRLAEEVRPKNGDPVPQPIAVGDTSPGQRRSRRSCSASLSTRRIPRHRVFERHWDWHLIESRRRRNACLTVRPY